MIVPKGPQVSWIPRSEWVTALVTTGHVVLATLASGHIILTKRDVRSAIGWIGMVWLSPYLGTMLYILLGINRIQIKATMLRKDQPHAVPADDEDAPAEELSRALDVDAAHMAALVTFMGNVAHRPLTKGNTVKPLIGGAEAYPAMIAAIRGASRSVGLASYIFNDDAVGEQFVEALAGAKDRGVEVRVLVDAVGSRYHRPTIFKALRKAGIDARAFLPSLVPSYFAYFNLRNHRKVLVVDSSLGFTGGMNIDREFDARYSDGPPRTDLHFALKGPVVNTLREVFAEDWAFRTDEILAGGAWEDGEEEPGKVLARGVIDGPDNDLDNLLFGYLGGLNAARDRVAILTPYFLPDSRLISALSAAAMRGVTVDVLVPKVNNLALVGWACTAQLWEVLEHGCRVWAVPPPFDHTKLMVVDECWSYFGSGNWDARSLRLNFEFNVEAYDRTLAGELEAMVQARRLLSEPITRGQVDGRSLVVKLRDGTARLLSPYL